VWVGVVYDGGAYVTTITEATPADSGLWATACAGAGSIIGIV